VGGGMLAGILVAGLAGQGPRPPDSGGSTSGGGGRIN